MCGFHSCWGYWGVNIRWLMIGWSCSPRCDCKVTVFLWRCKLFLTKNTANFQIYVTNMCDLRLLVERKVVFLSWLKNKK